jgi:hypothetical protein
VDAVGSVRAGQAQAFGSVFNATAVDPPAARVFSLDWEDGSDAVLARSATTAPSSTRASRTITA